MKKRVINFGDNRLFGGVGEWGLDLTAWAGGMEWGILLRRIPEFFRFSNVS